MVSSFSKLHDASCFDFQRPYVALGNKPNFSVFNPFFYIPADTFSLQIDSPVNGNLLKVFTYRKYTTIPPFLCRKPWLMMCLKNTSTTEYVYNWKIQHSQCLKYFLFLLFFYGKGSIKSCILWIEYHFFMFQGNNLTGYYVSTLMMLLGQWKFTNG